MSEAQALPGGAHSPVKGPDEYMKDCITLW